MSSPRRRRLRNRPITSDRASADVSGGQTAVDLASAVAVLQEFVRHHATSASAATAAGNASSAGSHQLLADVAREAVPAGWMPPPPPWTPSSILVEAIDEGLATATQFLDAGRGETDAVTTLRQSIRLAAGLLGH